MKIYEQRVGDLNVLRKMALCITWRGWLEPGRRCIGGEGREWREGAPRELSSGSYSCPPPATEPTWTPRWS